MLERLLESLSDRLLDGSRLKRLTLETHGETEFDHRHGLESREKRSDLCARILECCLSAEELQVYAELPRRVKPTELDVVLEKLGKLGRLKKLNIVGVEGLESLPRYVVSSQNTSLCVGS